MVQYSNLNSVIEHVKRHAVYSLIAICCMTTSCAYYPRLTGIPLIKEKGDTRIEGGLTFMPPNFQASVSHGATDNIAIQVAGTANYEGYYGHVAIGHYNNIEDRMVMEFYGGFGYGYSDAYKSSTGGRLNGNFQNYFAQFNFGNIERNKANLEYGLGVKLGYWASKMTDNNYFVFHEQNKPLPVHNLNGIFAEPTVFMRLGGPKLKFHAALGGCWWFQLTNTDKELPWWPINIGIGFSYSFGGVSK